uniref:Uncharacterized protein n=1 Tax=Ananas comosus var. bracteatus TaxID=296719 RepID=A0A6V7NTB0_ANACO|nr:unnamed protein product [Ananas comosus var. bracteatus]
MNFIPEDNGKGKYSSSEPMSIDYPSSSVENLDMSVASLEKFCKDVARAFFKDWGFISHQINSYNGFRAHGLQDFFGSPGEITVEPGYDPSKIGEVYSHEKSEKAKSGKDQAVHKRMWTDEKEITIGRLPVMWALPGNAFPGVHGEIPVNCLFWERKYDNQDNFRNKRLDLAGELLARELRSHIRHAERQ